MPLCGYFTLHMQPKVDIQLMLVHNLTILGISTLVLYLRHYVAIKKEFKLVAPLGAVISKDCFPWAYTALSSRYTA